MRLKMTDFSIFKGETGFLAFCPCNADPIPVCLGQKWPGRHLGVRFDMFNESAETKNVFHFSI